MQPTHNKKTVKTKECRLRKGIALRSLHSVAGQPHEDPDMVRCLIPVHHAVGAQANGGKGFLQAILEHIQPLPYTKPLLGAAGAAVVAAAAAAAGCWLLQQL